MARQKPTTRIAAARIPYHRSSDPMRATAAPFRPGRTAQTSAQMIPKMAKIRRWWPMASDRSSMARVLEMLELYRRTDRVGSHQGAARRLSSFPPFPSPPVVSGLEPWQFRLHPRGEQSACIYGDAVSDAEPKVPQPDRHRLSRIRQGKNDLSTRCASLTEVMRP